LGEEVLIQDGEMCLNALDYDGNGLVNLTSLLGCCHENKTMTKIKQMLCLSFFLYYW